MKRTQSKEAKQIVALVEKAAALTEGKGKAAFPEFKEKGSEWFRGETYIFVLSKIEAVSSFP
ncbi:MAG: hypothetical protein DMG25_13630 [Acidobacteria bacterium]|nr:MAG: hypothetical protein DMG25_13630 [Acidobacteriota bacterium]